MHTLFNINKEQCTKLAKNFHTSERGKKTAVQRDYLHKNYLRYCNK